MKKKLLTPLKNLLLLRILTDGVRQ